jgi:hypothetical protein
VEVGKAVLAAALAVAIFLLTIHLYAQAPTTGYPQRTPADAVTIERAGSPTARTAPSATATMLEAATEGRICCDPTSC